MENLQNFGASTMDGSLVRDLEQRKPGRGHSDIMSCRLKNRERQRRYRARKRLEADMKRAALNRSTPLQLQRNLMVMSPAHIAKEIGKRMPEKPIYLRNMKSNSMDLLILILLQPAEIKCLLCPLRPMQTQRQILNPQELYLVEDIGRWRRGIRKADIGHNLVSEMDLCFKS